MFATFLPPISDSTIVTMALLGHHAKMLGNSSHYAKTAINLTVWLVLSGLGRDTCSYFCIFFLRAIQRACVTGCTGRVWPVIHDRAESSAVYNVRLIVTNSVDRVCYCLAKHGVVVCSSVRIRKYSPTATMVKPRA